MDGGNPAPAPERPRGWRQYLVGVLVILAFAALTYWLRTR